MNLQLDLNQIDLKIFLETSITNGKELMALNVFSLSSPKKYEMNELKKESADELYEQLVNNGKYVYVNFSSNAMDEELACLDGNTYFYINEEEVEEYFEYEEVPDGFQAYKNLRIYEDSSVGFLLKYNDSKLLIQSAIIDLTYSSIDTIDDVELLNGPMDSYLKKFMK